MWWLKLSGRAFARSWGRDVMLYTGGVSFFALLAVFPAIAILIGLYKVGLSISEVSAAGIAEPASGTDVALSCGRSELTERSSTHMAWKSDCSMSFASATRSSGREAG